MNDALYLAGELLGKKLVVQSGQGLYRYTITELEVYRGGEDKASHASRGRTPRNEIMFGKGGFVYIYLIYGIHWMLNVVTGKEEDPQALLVRGIQHINGPGRLTKALGIDRSFHGEDLVHSSRIWIEDNSVTNREILQKPRIGIDYAGTYWKEKPWRFVLKSRNTS